MDFQNMTFAGDYFKGLALYNRWANGKIYDAVATLAADDYMKDMGAFFGSVHGTLNHIVVGDLIWTGRMADKSIAHLKLDHVPYDDFKDLRAARVALDDEIIALMTTLQLGEMARPFTFNDLKGNPHTVPLCMALGHVFNHQTHHRGQVHGLLSQLGIMPPAIDLGYFTLEQLEAGK